MRIAHTSALFGALLALAACGPTGGGGDGGGTGDAATPTDSGGGGGGGDSGGGGDGGGREGGTSSDPCSATTSNASSTVGCNGGFVSGPNPANGPEGPCTIRLDGDMYTQGTCSSTQAICGSEDEAATMGVCFVFCTPSAPGYVSKGNCPRGFRCFAEEGADPLCYRDCNAANPCPSGMTCDGDGSCLPM